MLGPRSYLRQYSSPGILTCVPRPATPLSSTWLAVFTPLRLARRAMQSTVVVVVASLRGPMHETPNLRSKLLLLLMRLPLRQRK